MLNGGHQPSAVRIGDWKLLDMKLGKPPPATFIVPPGTVGLRMGQKFRKHGIRASHTAEVILDESYAAGDEGHQETGRLGNARALASVAVHFFSGTRWNRLFHQIR